MITPYYQDALITLYCCDCLDALDLIAGADLLLTDPPYPNNAGHFVEDIAAAERVLQATRATRVLTFWHPLQTPPVPLPLVARHIWHRSNSNRPGNYEAIYEFADEPERPSMVWSYPVVYPGMTGCTDATGHPTQKHVGLMERLIELRPCRVIADPFAGSGTTLVAAKRLGYPAIGIERDAQHCADAARRLTLTMQGRLPLAV